MRTTIILLILILINIKSNILLCEEKNVWTEITSLDTPLVDQLSTLYHKTSKPLLVLVTQGKFCPPCLRLENALKENPPLMKYLYENYTLISIDPKKYPNLMEMFLNKDKNVLKVDATPTILKMSLSLEKIVEVSQDISSQGTSKTNQNPICSTNGIISQLTQLIPSKENKDLYGALMDEFIKSKK